jgi:ABC-type polysaccharide/polyol phosphate export permease
MIFEPRVYRNTGSSALAQLELIYHCTVQNIRATHRTGGLGIVINIIQVVVLVALFAAVMLTLGMRGSAIRGDFLLYIMSGVFLFKVHVKAIGAVFGADGPTSPMMLHAPMNTIVSIVSSALGALYIQTVSLLVILFVYHAAFTPITIDEPVGALAAYLLAWLSGCAGGMVFRAAKPWAPRPVTLVKTVYQRANMFASGKMFLANSIPVFILPWFIWNPLFHAIDQARGYVFLNYNPHHTTMLYPLWFSLALITVGLMGEFFTRKHASASWAA